MKRIVPAALGLGLTLASLLVASPPVVRSGVAIHASLSGSKIYYSSANWSGYADTAAKPFTYVTGKWKEPFVTCDNTPPEAAAFWVGLDGWTSPTVEQGGTIAQCNDGSPTSYYAWWEMYPTNNITYLYQVYPGDQIQATVSYAKGIYKITVADLNKQHKRSETISTACAANVTCDNSSAEWIAEAPTYGTTIANLPEWNAPGNKLGFSGGFATSSGNKLAISKYAHTLIELYTGDLVAAPNSLGSQGQGFTDVWYAEN